MKGLKKLALVSAIAAISAGAQAELKALDDSSMGQLTGQAGLTIDLQTKVTIGEFAYKDAGFLVLQDISLGGSTSAAELAFQTATGNTTGLLDNIRLTIDVAGAGGVGQENTFQYGFSEVIGLAAVHASKGNGNAGILAAATRILTSGASASTDVTTGLAIDDVKSYGDGDLKIHFGFTDAWQKGGGFGAYAAGKGSDNAGGTASLGTLTYDAARAIASRAVDFNFSIDTIGLASSSYVIGTKGVEKQNKVTGTDATANTTALISGLSINGFLGPADLHIENLGNGFGGTVGRGNANSKINWDSYFKITDLDVYVDIVGVQITDMQIHNNRGDLSGIDGTSSFGFAHSKRQIFAVKDAVLQLGLANSQTPTALNGGGVYHDGIAVNTVFKGDRDIGALSFGDTGVSIGSLHWTDINATTNWTISAH